MTGEVGVLLAVVAGWYLADARSVVLAVMLPFLAVTAVQTVGIATGNAVSPPSTVSQASYYAVQLLILAFTLGIALQVSALRYRGTGRHPDASGRRRAYIANSVLALLVVGGNLLDRALFAQTAVNHHRESGSPPLLGIVGIALLVLVCAGLGVATLARRLRPAAGAV